MNFKTGMKCATAVSLALLLSTAQAADDPNATNSANTMTGKQKATAIGATTGAVAGAVVGGPVGAVVGAGIGGYIGHEGTDSNGKTNAGHAADSKVRSAQAALSGQGYDVGKVDGQFGPNTQSAVRRFQSERGLTPSGMLDDATLAALGVRS